MNYCKQLRLIVTRDKMWIEYEHKTTTNIIPVNGYQEATAMLSGLQSGVDEWVEQEDK